MMGRACSIVLLLILGVLSFSLGEDLLTYRDTVGNIDEVFPPSSNETDIGWEKIIDLLSAENADEETGIEEMKRYFKLDDQLPSPLRIQQRRSKRQTFNPFGIFSRNPFECFRLERWLAGFTVGSSGVNNKEWIKILSTDDNGAATSGSKANLITAMQAGSRIKVRIGFIPYIAEVQSCKLTSPPTDVCCQGIHHIFAPTFGTFPFNTFLWLSVVCTTGNLNVVAQYPGNGFVTELKVTQSFDWFIYRNKDGSYDDPILSTNSGGNIFSGSVSALETAVRAGKSLTVVRDNIALAPIENVQLRENTVSAQHVWRFGMNFVSNQIEFVRDPDLYWRFALFTTSGSRDLARWFYGTLTLGNQTSDTVALNWYAGDDWIEAFTSTNCMQFYGRQSRFLLRSKIEQGVPIKVRFGQTYAEVDNLVISGEDISAQVIAVVAREDADTLKSNINWEFNLLSTRGTVLTYRPRVGSFITAPEGNTRVSQDITWFIDSKTWNLVYHITNTGFVRAGSPQAVRSAAENGADIRVGYKRNNEPGFRFQTVDNVFFNTNPPNVAVQLIRLLKDVSGPGGQYQLSNLPTWSYTFLTTQGIMQKTEWIVGARFNVGRVTERVEIKFFTSP